MVQDSGHPEDAQHSEPTRKGAIGSPDGGRSSPKTTSEYRSRQPTILPYTSSDSHENIENAEDFFGPATAIENENDDGEIEESAPHMPEISRSNPVLRDASQMEQMQLKYFQLQIELKRIRDELRAAGRLQTPSNENNDTGDLTDLETVRDKDVGTLPQENHEDNLRTVVAVLKSEKAKAHEQNETLRLSEIRLQQENATLKSELHETQSRVTALSSEVQQAASWDGKNELESLRLELSRLHEDLSISKSKEMAQTRENDRLKDELETAKSNKRTHSESGPSKEELEDLRSRLARTLNIKSQISAMLEEQLDINEKNERLLFDAERHISNLHTDLNSSQLEIERSTLALSNLNDNLFKETQANKTLTDQISQLETKLTASQSHIVQLQQYNESQAESRNEDKAVRQEQERRMSQQQEEIGRLTTERENLKASLHSYQLDLDNRKSRAIEINTRLEEAEKRNRLLSDLMAQGSKDYTDAQKEIDRLRNILQEKEIDIDHERREAADLLSSQQRLKESLSDLKKQLTALDQAKTSEISRLQTDVDTLHSRLNDEKERHKVVIADLNEKRSKDFAYARERAKDELNKARIDNTQRENELKTVIVSLENEILDLKDVKATLATERDGLLVRERKDKSQKSSLETALTEISQRLADAEHESQRARSDAVDFKSKYDSARRAEEALVSKTRQLEQTVSNQAIRLQELSTEDIGSLKRQAQDGLVSVNELIRLREEFSRQAAEWVVLSGSLNMDIQQLTESNRRLEEELNMLKTNEVQREMQLRSTVQGAHQRDIEHLQKDYQYTLDVLNNSFTESEKERDNLKKQYLDCKANLQNAEFELSMKTQSLDQSTKAIEYVNQEFQNSLETIQKLQSEKVQLHDKAAELEANINEATTTIDSKNATVDELNKKLNESVLSMKVEANKRNQIEEQFYGREKIFREYSERLFAIVYANSQQIQSLIFIKSYFTKCFPRTDLIIDAQGRPLYRKRRTFRDAAFFALALVKFRRAVREGVMRNAQDSEQLLTRS